MRRCIATGNDDDFIRCWFEVPSEELCRLNKYDETKKWFFIACGGEHRRWYGNISKVLNWADDGAKLKAFNDRTGKSTFRNVQFMFRNGLTYTYTSMGSGVFNTRLLHDSMASIGVGPVMVDAKVNQYELLGYTNSKVFAWYWDIMYGKVSTFETGNVGKVVFRDSPHEVEKISEKCVEICRDDWNSFESAYNFLNHPLVTNCRLVSDAFEIWNRDCITRYSRLRDYEYKINSILIETYELQDELTPEVDDKDVTVRKADLQRDIRSLISYAVGCMFGRYSLDVPGLAYAGGEWNDSKYSSFIPDKDNILPITDEEYFQDDIVGLFCGWLKKVYGADTLEENLDFIAKALGNKGNTSREVIRNYFLNDFFKDHCSTYSVTGSGKRPIYWLFDSGKQNGFKALVYMHRYDENTIGNLRIDYLHRMERVYESEIARMQDIIDNSRDGREVTKATKRKEKLQKQIKECKEYDEKIAHLALARIPIDLDDGVKVNYEKVQTVDGKKYPVLAKI